MTVLVTEDFDGPAGRRLIARVQEEYVVRYGGQDDTPLAPGEFAPPGGLFLVAYVHGEAVGCGGYRTAGPGIAEMKRMYVEPAIRGRGVARVLLAALEDAARAAGFQEMRLETGSKQPEAVALYASSGYAAIAPYGYYRDAPGNRCFAKPL